MLVMMVSGSHGVDGCDDECGHGLVAMVTDDDGGFDAGGDYNVDGDGNDDDDNNDDDDKGDDDDDGGNNDGDDGGA